ncbi:MAG TPA: arginine deiminase-related protein [Cryomorphaceae bacterium]|nr:arginine deiminase-related protein [Cryomorphaceae bacterium]
MSKQITSTIMMVRPVNFRFNEETAKNNYYQKVLEGLDSAKANELAVAEFDAFVEKLRGHGIDVVVFQDDELPSTPDSIFPNNWVSFHEDGRIATYPMYAENRRGERREEMFELLADDFGFHVEEIEDFSGFESEGIFLEGTGSMILDRENRIAYAAISLRTDITVLETWCERFDYEYVAFTANQTVNGERLPIYHTNVMMCLGRNFSVICLNCIDDKTERNDVLDSLKKTGKKIIEISEAQKEHFAGNMLNVANKEGKEFLVMSTAAYSSLRPDQIEAIEKHATIIHSSLDTIEALGGGSARCMMAEVFLPKIEKND